MNGRECRGGGHTPAHPDWPGCHRVLQSDQSPLLSGGRVRVGHEFSVQAMYSKAAVEEVTHCI